MFAIVTKSLTKIGVLTAHPLAFVVVSVYGLLWYMFESNAFGWNAGATMAIWFMTLFMQRAEHRDTQAI